MYPEVHDTILGECITLILNWIAIFNDLEDQSKDPVDILGEWISSPSKRYEISDLHLITAKFQ